MAAANLSVSSIPSSVNQVAAIDLIVSVTDDTGAPITGLNAGNFVVHWGLDAQRLAPSFLRPPPHPALSPTSWGEGKIRWALQI